MLLLTLVFFLCGQFKVKSCRLLLMYLLASYGTIPILRHQIDWVGGVRKKLIFAEVQYYLRLHSRMDGSEKGQKCADVI